MSVCPMCSSELTIENGWQARLKDGSMHQLGTCDNPGCASCGSTFSVNFRAMTGEERAHYGEFLSRYGKQLPHYPKEES